jgi:hypothetical protein
MTENVDHILIDKQISYTAVKLPVVLSLLQNELWKKIKNLRKKRYLQMWRIPTKL